MSKFRDYTQEFQDFLAHADADSRTSHLTDEELEIKERCEESLYEFVKHAWVHSVGTSFIDGWHMEAICAHLEALYDLQISNLLINQPFRSGKSITSAVMFPAWGFTQDSDQSFIYTSYSESLSVRDSLATRRLMESAWYTKLWGNEVSLRKDVRNKKHFETTNRGYRTATSTGGSATGLGANFIVCLHNNARIYTEKGEITIGEIVDNALDVLVLSYNHEKNIVEYKPILEYMKFPGSELLEIDFGDETIQCTAEHPIYVEGKGYIRADQLMEGDIVISL